MLGSVNLSKVLFFSEADSAPPIYPCVHPPSHLSIHVSMRPNIQPLCFPQSIQIFILLSIHPFIHLFTHSVSSPPFVLYPPSHLKPMHSSILHPASTHPYIFPSIHPFMYSSIRPPFLQLSIYLSIYILPSTFFFNHLLIRFFSTTHLSAEIHNLTL